jgi:antitoxin Phd
MQNSVQQTSPVAWRLQDAKAQFSALVDIAMRGVPQHVTRSGKRAVVVLSELDFEALQRSATGRAHTPPSFIEHLLAIPKAATNYALDAQSLDVQPRTIDFS